MSKAYAGSWKQQRQRVLKRDGYVCQLCGCDLSVLPSFDRTVDHIIPVASGKKAWTDDELVAMCRSCNSWKRDRTVMRTAYFNKRYIRTHA